MDDSGIVVHRQLMAVEMKLIKEKVMLYQTILAKCLQKIELLIIGRNNLWKINVYLL